MGAFSPPPPPSRAHTMAGCVRRWCAQVFLPQGLHYPCVNVGDCLAGSGSHPHDLTSAFHHPALSGPSPMSPSECWGLLTNQGLYLVISVGEAGICRDILCFRA